MKRIGLVTLAMVLALASLGIAYAAWTDEITIRGSVETGTVDLNVVDFSCTTIYKYLGQDDYQIPGGVIEPDDLVRWHGWCGDDPYADNSDFLEVASAEAFCPVAPPPGSDSDEPIDLVWVSFNNLFPCQDFTADFMLHYDGSIPVKLYAEVLSWQADEALAAAIASGEVSVDFNAWEAEWEEVATAEGLWVKGAQVEIGHQMHFCEHLWVEMTIHLPQDNSLMNQSGSFRAKIWAVQWNQYEYWLENEKDA